MKNYSYILKCVFYFYRHVFNQNYKLDFVVAVVTSGFLLFQLFLINVIFSSFDLIPFLFSEEIIYVFIAANTAFNYYMIKRNKILEEVEVNPSRAKALVGYFFATIILLSYYIIFTS